MKTQLQLDADTLITGTPIAAKIILEWPDIVEDKIDAALSDAYVAGASLNLVTTPVSPYNLKCRQLSVANLEVCNYFSRRRRALRASAVLLISRTSASVSFTRR